MAATPERKRETGGAKAGGVAPVTLALLLAALGAATARAQTTTTPPAAPQETSAQTPATEETGKTAGNYNVQESIEGGYRDSMIGGNLNNYDTFNDLTSGWRLFDYTIDMRSLNHQGLFFDNLNFTNFGYGGDPNDVSRLRVDKNKWYDFHGTFRRDKDIWDYNLLANPLNTSTSPVPTPITNSPHALYLSRRMQDYDVTVLPQSRVRFRFGYSRNLDEGPAFTTLEGGTDTEIAENVRDATNAFRFGADYVGLPKTTLAFDEFLAYSRIDNTAADNNLTYQLSNGTPVDLGIVFIGTTPCAAPILNAATTPPTATPTCNGYTSYSQMQDPRSSFPTEQFRFQTTYVKNLSLSGSAEYSSGQNSVPDYHDMMTGWTSRTLLAGSTTGGPAEAKRVTVNASLTGEYRITDKLSVIDDFGFNNWRIPSMWATADTSLFASPPTAVGQAGMLLPISTVTPATFAATCPTAPYNQAGCPQHNASSPADVTDELVSQYLAQNIRENTVEVKYDFARRLTGLVGYEFRARTIADFSATFDTGEIYLPGGMGGIAANDYFAARGDCALVSGAPPAGCSYNAATGIMSEGSPTNLVPEAGNDTGRNLYEIHEQDALIGVVARPMDTLRINSDLLFGYNDNSFTRISPRQVQSYKIHLNYKPAPYATVDGAVDIHENRDNVSMVNNLEHGRTYSFVTTLAPSEKLWVDFGYNYTDVYTQTEICFPDTGSTIFTTPCPVPAASSPLGTLSMYASHQHYAYGDVMWKPYARVTAMLGYAGSIVRGNTTLLSPVAPTGTLDFNYLTPFVSLTVNVYKGLAYKMAWNYYGYNDEGVANPIGLAALPSQNFNGSNVTISVRYAF